jgi:type IV pilus assembly protein PilM
VLAVVTPAPVLAEYEAAVRAAGYEPGAVLPAALATLETLMGSANETALVAHLSPQAMTTAITVGNDLLLYRTLELPTGEAERVQEIQRGIAVASAYFEDCTGAALMRIHYTGCVDADTFAQLTGTPELEIVELAPHPETGAATSLGSASLAAVAGALTGAGL